MTAPLQDAAATRIGRANVLLVGGLTASDTSSSAVRVVGPNGGRLLEWAKTDDLGALECPR
jgi:hypothetical protein